MSGSMNEAAETTAYVPGSWFGIVGSGATVLLPPSEKDRAGTLWALVDDGAGFDDVLDALVSAGLRKLPGFVLVATEDATTKVVVRGPSTVSFDSAEGTVEVDGRDSATWVERTLTGVTRMRADLEDTADTAGSAGTDSPSYVLTAGLTRVSRIEVPAPAAEASAAGAGPAAGGAVAAPVPAAPVDDSLVREDEAEPGPAEKPVAASYAPEAVEADGDPSLHESDTTDFAVPAEAAAPGDEVPEETGEDAGEEHVEEAGRPAPGPDQVPPPPSAPPAGFVPPAPPSGPPSAPPPPPSAPPAPPESSPEAAPEAPADDHDGLTRAGLPSPDLARPLPGIPGQPAAPSVTAVAVARLEFSSGDRVDVDRVVLVGRSPEAGRVSASEQPLLVTVPSPHQEISSTHCEIRPGSGADHGAAVVTDLGSTNGTVLVQPGMGPEELRPGVPVQLMPGAVIDLGDGLTIRVTNP